MQSVGERKEEGFFVLVVLDLGSRERACRRNDRQERGQTGMIGFCPGNAGLEIGDVAFDLGGAAIADGAVADDAVAKAAAEPGGNVCLLYTSRCV